MSSTRSSSSSKHSPNYHCISHAVPLSFLRVQQILKDGKCIAPACRVCKVLLTIACPPRQLNCGHVLCGPCILKKCMRENESRCPVCAFKATPPTFEYVLKDEAGQFPKMHPKLFANAVSKALYGYRRCLQDPDYEPTEPTKSHSRGGLSAPNRERGLCYVGQKERHKLTVAAMVILGCPPQPSFHSSDAELWLYALWEAIDTLSSSRYHDTHADLTDALVSQTLRAVARVRGLDVEGAETEALRAEVARAVALAAEFEGLISLLCIELCRMDMVVYHRFWLRLHQWETGVES